PGLAGRGPGTPSPGARGRPAPGGGGGSGRGDATRGPGAGRRAVLQHPRLGARARSRALRGPEPRRAAPGRPEPRLVAGPGHPGPPHRAAGPGLMTSLSILLVDDDENFRERMARALRDRGHEVRTAGSPGEAERLAAEDSPECAVVDLRMPGGSGLDVVAALKTIDPATAGGAPTGY